MFNFFPKSYRSWREVAKYGRLSQAIDDNIFHMYFARCIPKATATNSEYVILIASPWLQWLHESASELFVYVHYLLTYLLTYLLNYLSTYLLTYLATYLLT